LGVYINHDFERTLTLASNAVILRRVTGFLFILSSLVDIVTCGNHMLEPLLYSMTVEYDHDLKNWGKTVRNSFRCAIWNFAAFVGGGWMPSSQRWATDQPNSVALLQFRAESSANAKD
jgi:hypothetical protein